MRERRREDSREKQRLGLSVGKCNHRGGTVPCVCVNIYIYIYIGGVMEYLVDFVGFFDKEKKKGEKVNDNGK